MSYGKLNLTTVIIASGASTSSEVVFGGKAYDRIAVCVGTMSTAAAVRVQHSPDGTNYFGAFHPVVNTATSTQINQMIIASGIGTGGGSTHLPIGGFRQIRFVASATVDNGVSFTVIASD